MKPSQFLKSAREAKGFTIVELAEKAKVQPSLIRKYEWGDVCPRPNNAIKISRVLDVDPMKLMTGKIFAQK